MNLVKELRKALIENSLSKGEDPEAYKKLAQTGFILAHPVKIGGKDKRPDNGIDYHSTIKFFDKESDNPEHAHETASKLEHQHIDPKKVDIKPKVLKDRNGNDVYAIGLHGHHANKIKEHHDKFSHFGNKENYEWGAHISVPKAIHDEIKTKGHKTAHEAGIEFGPAELRRGPKTLQTYHPKMKKSEELEIKHPSDLNLDKGDKDISEKSLADIQRETAWTWASRAAACYEKLAKTGDWKWKTDAEEYRHEAVEHAALIGDSHPHVLEEIHKSLEKYRNVSEEKALDKAEPLLKPWSSQAQAAWGHSPEGKKALGGEAAVKEWDNATKGKHLPKHVAKSEGPITFHHESKLPKNIKIGKEHQPSGEVGEHGENHRLNTTDSHYYAVHGGKVIGHIGIKSDPDDYHKPVINASYVNPEHRSKGVGLGLYHHVLSKEPHLASDNAREPGANVIWNKLKQKHPKNIVHDKKTDRFVWHNPTLGKSEILEKGAVKNALTAGMMATALASPQHIEAKTHSPGALHPQVSASPNTGYDRQKMLNALSQVESSGGKNTHHKPTSMGTAYGRFAEMPDVIHDTIRLNPDLKRKHGKALRLQGDNLNRYMQDNKGLEDLIAQKHLGRLEHHFGQNPEAIAYAWNHGITGTNKSLKAKQNILEHPYVQKFKHYYESEK